MSPRLSATLLAVAALISLPFAAPAQQSQPIERIAAVVDENVVLQSELNQAMRNVVAQYAGREDQLPPRAVLERQVLERLVLTRLQVERAKTNGIRVSDQGTELAVATIAQQNSLSVDGLRQRLAADGLSFDDFRRSLNDEIMVQRLRQSFAQSRINVSESEVDAALAQQASGGKQYHLAHILVGLPEGATAEQIATGQRKIEGIKAVIDRGELTFNAAAVRYSDSPNALEGGDPAGAAWTRSRAPSRARSATWVPARSLARSAVPAASSCCSWSRSATRPATPPPRRPSPSTTCATSSPG